MDISNSWHSNTNSQETFNKNTAIHTIQDIGCIAVNKKLLHTRKGDYFYEHNTNCKHISTLCH